MTRSWILLVLGPLVFAVGPFSDPAPPAVQTLPPMPALVPKKNPDVQFHSKPKPLPPGAVVEDWESFRGPTHDSISRETKLLVNWPNGGPKLVWEMRKGTGYSSPAISGDHLVYFSRVGNVENVVSLHSETGEKYWDFSYPTKFEDRYGYNNGPRATPVIDGDRVYTFGAEGKLYCFKIANGASVLEARHLRGIQGATGLLRHRVDAAH